MDSTHETCTTTNSLSEEGTPTKWYNCNNEKKYAKPSTKKSGVENKPENEIKASPKRGNRAMMDKLKNIFTPQRKFREIEQEIAALERTLGIEPCISREPNLRLRVSSIRTKISES